MFRKQSVLAARRLLERKRAHLAARDFQRGKTGEGKRGVAEEVALAPASRLRAGRLARRLLERKHAHLAAARLVGRQEGEGKAGGRRKVGARARRKAEGQTVAESGRTCLGARG